MEKINIAELLKDCPQGMELDCTMFENLKFDYIKEDTDFPIKCFIENESSPVSFNKYGKFNTHNKAKCVIFPKGKTTWEGFVPPCKFKDGDVVATTTGRWIGITEGGKNDCFIPTYCIIDSDGKFKAYFGRKDKWSFSRLATEEEKQKLFDAIKENGYHWNPETKKMEELIEPKFKVGDRIKHKTHISRGDIVTAIKDTHYILNDELALPFVFQDEYELVPNKFDINTLVPFESKVLVRDKESHKWKPAIWGFYDKDSLDYQIRVVGGYIYRYCIPYDGNEHLLATTNDCDEYYKTWK